MCWVDTTLHSSGPITVSKRVTVHVSMCRGIVVRYICRVYGTGLLPLNSDPLSQSLASNLMSVEQHSYGEEDLTILWQWKWIIWLQRKTNGALKWPESAVSDSQETCSYRTRILIMTESSGQAGSGGLLNTLTPLLAIMALLGTISSISTNTW